MSQRTYIVDLKQRTTSERHAYREGSLFTIKMCIQILEEAPSREDAIKLLTELAVLQENVRSADPR